MELFHLRYFLAVADELTLTRAAERLRLAPSPLSRRIRDLERELGTALFTRSSRGMALTAAGRALVPVVMAMMAWGDRFATPPGGPPMRLHHETCGAGFTPTVCCSACGEPIDPDDVRASPGPGAAPGPGTRVLAERFAGADAPGSTSGNDQDEHSG